MGNEWKENLASFFEGLRILEISKKETIENFDQFCEFIVEPGFESLDEELKQFGIKSKSSKSKGKSITFQINFTKSRIDNFQYIIFLPKNSLELKLKLRIRGRKRKKSLMEEKEEPFMENVEPLDILKLKKEDIILDVIEYYRRFKYEAHGKTG
ncbi:MAG: hypothetical protein E3J76_04755 [Candidatus Aminicenantes bacterium]|nr:MAG: hypothetical protein E3J76_04755 [Candidatus Aminicenantes bacterium]